MNIKMDILFLIVCKSRRIKIDNENIIEQKYKRKFPPENEMA